MGRVDKGVLCSVEGCVEKAVHSVSYAEASILEKEKGYKLRVEHGRVYLCEKHYKEFKKLRRKRERFERWRFSGG